MEEKEIKINVPDGYEIDKENSTFECIKFKPIEKKLPKTWEEFCYIHPREKGECWTDSNGNITRGTSRASRNFEKDKNVLPNYIYAKAMLALCQLIQLRDCYNDGWIPDWSNNKSKYSIVVIKDQLFRDERINLSCILAFKTEELRDEFLENFKDLIKVAKPLI